MAKRRKGKGKGRKKVAMTRRGGDPAPSTPPSDEDEAGADSEPPASDEGAKPPRDTSAAKTAAAASNDGDEDDGDADAPDAAADSEPPAEPSSGADDPPSSANAPDDDEDIPESAVGLPAGAAWARPLVAFEHRWTWFEVRLMFVSLLALMLVLVFWAAMGSMADSVESTVVKGTLFRQIAGASILGIIVRVATHKRLDDSKRAWLTIAAVVVGVTTARFWRGTGIELFDAFNDWLQKGSVFALFGGLKGVSTRLTMFVSLLGASLAAGAGTHIAIDAVVRLLPKKSRRPSAIVASLATCGVCLMSAWGFFDHVAITAMEAKVDSPPSEKLSHVVDEVDEHFFLLRKQLLLDLETFPRVLASEPWNDPKAFTGRDWNAFIDDNGFVERFGEEKVARLRASESNLETGYQPFIKTPGAGAAGRLLHTVDLMWALGFMMIGLRFLLRAVLLFAGHVKLDIDMDVTDDEGDLAGEGAS